MNRVEKWLVKGLLVAVALALPACGDETTSTTETVEEGGEEATEGGEEATEGGEEATEGGEEATEGGEEATEGGEEATEGGEEATEGGEEATEGGEEATEGGEEATEGGEEATEGGEEATEGGEEATESCYEKLMLLKNGVEGEINLELCDLTVNYVTTYTSMEGDEEVVTSFSFFVSGMDAEGLETTASQIYVTPVVTGQDDQGNDIVGFPYEIPQVGSIVNVTALKYENFNGQNEVTASANLEVVSVGDAWTVSLVDFGVPSEDTESMVVYGDMTIVSGDANELGQIAGSTLTVDYGAGDVQLYGGGELEDFLSDNPVCAGGTLTLSAGVITQYEDVHQIRVFDAANEVTVSGGNCVTYDDSNWGFEDWTSSNPPAGFINNGGDFTSTEFTTTAYAGDAACQLTWTSSSNQDFYQGYYVPVNEGETTTFDLAVWDADENGRLRMALTFYDADGESLGNEFPSDYSDDVTGNTEGWNVMTWSAVAPEGAVSVRGWVRMYDVTVGEEWAGEATVVIDEWSVTSAAL